MYRRGLCFSDCTCASIECNLAITACVIPYALPPRPPQVVASAIVDKYIGESARVIREMFGYAKEHAPCVIFMDEIDAIGGKRYNEGTSAGESVFNPVSAMRGVFCNTSHACLQRHSTMLF